MKMLTMRDEHPKDIDNKLLKIIDTIAEGIVLIDDEGRFIFANAAAARILGISSSDIVGRSFNDSCWKDFYLDDEEFTGEKDLFEILIATRKPLFGLERAIRRKDGAKRVISIDAAPMFDNEGTMAGIVASFIDVTARKEAEKALMASEELYRNLVETSPDGIILLDLDLKVLMVNRRALLMYGYDSVEEVAGKSVPELFDPGEKERVLRNAALRLKGLTPEIIEYKFIKKGGTSFLGELRASVVYDPEGSPRFYIGVVHDITAKRKMEEELLKASKLESLGILAGGIAHDFNNLLTTILGHITMVARQPGLSVQTRGGLGEAEKACLQARNLTRQFLTFASGGAPVRKAASLAALLKDTVSFTISGSKTRGEFSIGDDLWPAEIDEGQMSQVIGNLTINAVQAMPEGGTLKVRAENTVVAEGDGRPLKPGKYVKFSIEDTGSGIAPGHLSKIFDPFFTTKALGSGLGLTTSYSVVKNHDGAIFVDSVPGRGTTFDIYLPAGPEPSTEETKPPDLPLAEKRRVLLVDDEAAIRRVTGRLLRHLGYDVVLATEGMEAVGRYEEAVKSGAPFDAVIMDLTLQGSMGGKETIMKLIEIDPGVRAIVSSGYSDDPVMSDFRSFGFKGVITKPYTLEELAEILYEVIHL